MYFDPKTQNFTNESFTACVYRLLARDCHHTNGSPTAIAYACDYDESYKEPNEPTEVDVDADEWDEQDNGTLIYGMGVALTITDESTDPNLYAWEVADKDTKIAKVAKADKGVKNEVTGVFACLETKQYFDIAKILEMVRQLSAKAPKNFTLDYLSVLSPLAILTRRYNYKMGGGDFHFEGFSYNQETSNDHFITWALYNEVTAETANKFPTAHEVLIGYDFIKLQNLAGSWYLKNVVYLDRADQTALQGFTDISQEVFASYLFARS